MKEATIDLTVGALPRFPSTVNSHPRCPCPPGKPIYWASLASIAQRSPTSADTWPCAVAAASGSREARKPDDFDRACKTVDQFENGPIGIALRQANGARERHEVSACQSIILAVELEPHPVAAKSGKDSRRNRIKRRKANRREGFASGAAILRSARFLRCISPSAISQANIARRNRVSRSAAGSVESGRSPRAMRSMMP